MMVVEYIIREGREIEVETLESRAAPKQRKRAEHHIGCPVGWLKRVLPLAETKEHLAIAIWLHRRRAVCRDELFTAPNQELYEDLGLSRKVKYAALRHFERMNIIAVVRDNKRALRVRLLGVA